MLRRINPNKELQSYIIGVALGDGNLTNPNGRAPRLRVSCDLKYPKLINKITASLGELFPDNKVSSIRKGTTRCLDVMVHSNHLEDLVGWKVGQGSKYRQNAHVPEWIREDRKYIIPCLQGLIETDGCMYTDRGYKAVMFVNIVRDLSLDVYHMMQALNFSPRFYSLINFKTKFMSHPRYNVRLARNVDKFLSVVQPLKA